MAEKTTAQCSLHMTVLPKHFLDTLQILEASQLQTASRRLQGSTPPVFGLVRGPNNGWLVGWLVFNGTFSTNRLYHAIRQ